MKLKNVLLVVKDIEISKSFYKEIFGLQVLTDFGTKVLLSEGLVLQELGEWENAIGTKIFFGGHTMELYFEEYDLEAFVQKLEASKYHITYVSPLAEYAGEKVVRFYDPDNHLIEVKDRK